MGIYKSADGMQSVGVVRPAAGFPAWPASAIGRQVAVGTPSPIKDELYVQQSVIGNMATDYARRVAHLAGGIWTLKSDPGSSVQPPIDSLMRLGSNLYRISCDGNNIFDYKLHPGQLQRSDDDGETWSNVGPAPVNVGIYYWGVQAVTIAVDGVLWLCASVDGTTGDGGIPAPAIYKSTAASDGLVWTKEYEDTDKVTGNWRHLHDISAHPLDSNLVVAFGLAANTRETHLTQDGGLSFSKLSGGASGASTNRLLQTMDNGRLIHSRAAASRYSDDLGDEWVHGDSTTLIPSDLVRGIGGTLFLASGSADDEIYRSRDYGQSWILFAEDADFPAGGFFVIGLVYQPATDTLYIITSQTSSTARVLAIDSASLVAVNPTFRDITLNLDDLFTGAGSSIAARGIALP